ncbi:hypothetical protein BDY21DRAFT_355311 [Lineolata rhizophorae]|uniref:Uncharacterized protein n=1 Tax=Lineolata rhizophorae TaxID=578093 RepID=A0A6A6NP40_9PEZI|nr:hypothetical protein BDY21DRAFT_355311 [Lineolata rhizophorae]
MKGFKRHVVLSSLFSPFVTSSVQFEPHGHANLHHPFGLIPRSHLTNSNGTQIANGTGTGNRTDTGTETPPSCTVSSIHQGSFLKNLTVRCEPFIESIETCPGEVIGPGDRVRMARLFSSCAKDVITDSSKRLHVYLAPPEYLWGSRLTLPLMMTMVT